MSEELNTVVESNNEFTKKVHTILARKPGNVFFSPVSIHAILSLAYQGATGQTQEAFAKVLNLLDAEATAKGYETLMSSLNSLTGVTLLMANKLFLQESFQLQKHFKTVAVQQFSSEIDLEDFKKPAQAAKSINLWVEKKTNNKIRDLITEQDISPDTTLILVNAIYFKGSWAKPFKIENTNVEKFYVNNNDTIEVQMMHLYNAEFAYKDDHELESQILYLPYVKYKTGMLVILPKERKGIKKLEDKIQSADLTKMMSNMRRRSVNVSLPKFKIEQTIDFKDPLTELGLGMIYDRHSANFNGIIENTTQNLYVSQIVQKAFIEVNEEGTEAAAATGVRYVMCCMPPPPVTFTADHPFLIILCHRSSGEGTMSNLFQGRISNPQY